MARPKKIEETEGSVLNARKADVKLPEGQDTSVSENTEDQESEPVQIPKHIDDVLKVYPQYQNLYVGDKGGAYTEETTESLRGEAKLYKNPHYTA